MLEGSGVEVITIAKDLFEPEAAFQLYEEVLRRGLFVDILVNNAGLGQYGEFAETDIHASWLLSS